MSEFGIKVIKLNWCSVCILLCTCIYYILSIYNQALADCILLVLNCSQIAWCYHTRELGAFGIACCSPTHRTWRCQLRSFYIFLLPFIWTHLSNHGNCRGQRWKLSKPPFQPFTLWGVSKVSTCERLNRQQVVAIWLAIRNESHQKISKNC